MKILSKILIAVTLIAGLSLTSNNSVQAESQMIDLGTLGGDFGVALDINDNNQIVGVSNTEEEGDRHAFLWENGIMTDLTPGYESWAGAINQHGQIVGSSYMTGDQHATLWDNGQEIDLGTLYGYESVAHDINEQGQVVGSFRFYDGVYSLSRAFLWENGVMIDLGTLGGNSSKSSSINNRGEIVGWSTNAQGQSRPFIWKDGVMTDLGTLGGSFGGANVINSSGRIIGNSANAQDQSRPTLWFMGSITELVYPPYSISVNHISDSGNIVGEYQNRSYLWTNDTFIALGTLEGSTSLAYSVNNDGAVVGLMNNRRSGDGVHAFLWMP